MTVSLYVSYLGMVFTVSWFGIIAIGKKEAVDNQMLFRW